MLIIWLKRKRSASRAQTSYHKPNPPTIDRSRMWRLVPPPPPTSLVSRSIQEVRCTHMLQELVKLWVRGRRQRYLKQRLEHVAHDLTKVLHQVVGAVDVTARQNQVVISVIGKFSLLDSTVAML